MTYGENIVSVCQDNTGTDETIENHVNLQFFYWKTFNPIFSKMLSWNFFKLCSLEDLHLDYKRQIGHFKSLGLDVEKIAVIQK